MLSLCENNNPVGVTRDGLCAPVTVSVKVRSLMFCKLSVALTTNAYVVFADTLFGVPYINPLTVMINPVGRLPLMIAYVNDTAGRTAEADNCIGTISVNDG